MLETPSIRRYSFTCHTLSVGCDMSSENPSGADNQQERPSTAAWLDAIPHDLGHYVAGFVDGEGSFNVPIRRCSAIVDCRSASRSSFNVSQVGPEAPRAPAVGLRCRNGASRGDGVCVLRSHEAGGPRGTGLPVLRAVPASCSRRPMTWRSSVRSPRWSSQGDTCQSTASIEVLALRAPMNRGGKRRRSDEELIEALRS